MKMYINKIISKNIYKRYVIYKTYICKNKKLCK